jgi:hypothetical protein
MSPTNIIRVLCFAIPDYKTEQVLLTKNNGGLFAAVPYY